jgi:hypothetical protein
MQSTTSAAQEVIDAAAYVGLAVSVPLVLAGIVRPVILFRPRNARLCLSSKFNSFFSNIEKCSEAIAVRKRSAYFEKNGYPDNLPRIDKSWTRQREANVRLQQGARYSEESDCFFAKEGSR